MRRIDVDIAVVGGGLAGAATAWSAARRGRSVRLFEQFACGHHRGSSHGSARIFRRAYPDPLYVRLTGEARELWSGLEEVTGRSLLRVTGGLDHGGQDRLTRIGGMLADAGVEHEFLPPREAAARWPGMTFRGPVLFHPQAGVIDAERSIEAFLGAAREAGAVVTDNAAVQRIEPGEDGALVVTGTEVIRAGCVVAAAGSWVGPLLSGVIRLPPLRVTQQQIFHFPYADAGQAWPTFVHQAELSTYGLPGGRDGGPGGAQKIGEHSPGTLTTADTRDGIVDPQARARIVEYVRRWFPGLVPEPRNEATCLYTWTGNEDFILDRIGPVVVCSPCSGHGAKFAPLIGEIAAGLATGERPAPARFRLTQD